MPILIVCLLLVFSVVGSILLSMFKWIDGNDTDAPYLTIPLALGLLIWVAISANIPEEVIISEPMKVITVKTTVDGKEEFYQIVSENSYTKTNVTAALGKIVPEDTILVRETIRNYGWYGGIYYFPNKPTITYLREYKVEKK